MRKLILNWFIVLPIFLSIKVSTFATGIVISEIFPNPIGTDTKEEYIKIINLTNNPVDIADIKIDNQVITPLFENFEILGKGETIVIYDDSLELSNKAINIGFKQATIPSTSLNNSGDNIQLSINSSLEDSFVYSNSTEGIPIIRPVLNCAEYTNKLVDANLFNHGVISNLNLYLDFVPILQSEKNGSWSDLEFNSILPQNFRLWNSKCGVLNKIFDWSENGNEWMPIQEVNTIDVTKSEIFVRYNPTGEIFKYESKVQTNIKINEIWNSPIPESTCNFDGNKYFSFPWVEIEHDGFDQNSNLNIQDNLGNIYKLKIVEYSSKYAIFQLEKPFLNSATSIELFLDNKTIDSVNFQPSNGYESLARIEDSMKDGYYPTPLNINQKFSPDFEILEVNPYPSDGKESITVKNVSSTTHNLYLVNINDKTSKQMPLTCSNLKPNSTITIYYPNLPISLNNDGDLIELRNQQGEMITSTEYPKLLKDEKWIFNGREFKIETVGNDEENEDEQNKQLLVSIKSESDNTELPDHSFEKVISQPIHIPFQKPRIYRWLEDEGKTQISSSTKTNHKKIIPSKMMGSGLLAISGIILFQIPESKNFLIGIYEIIKKKLLN